MTPAERLQALMKADPRPDAEKAEAAGMSRQAWNRYKHGPTEPSVSNAGRILIDGLNLTWADLDGPS